VSNPLLLGPRLTIRALDDFHTMAQAAGQLASTLEALDRRADRIETQLATVIDVARQIEARGEEAIATAERIDRQARAALRLARRVDQRVVEVLAASETISERALEVAARGAEVAAALPLLQRALELAEPLEGAVERFGRIVDRLPGAVARGRARGAGAR
jgi:methyl-accepting chemotaxis protein